MQSQFNNQAIEMLPRVLGFIKVSIHAPTRSATWGDGIKVLSKSEALEWCEGANVDTDIIQQYFEIQEA